MTHLSVSVQRREVEEQRLSQGHAVNGVVQVVAPVQLHLGAERKVRSTVDGLETAEQRRRTYRERRQELGRRVDVPAEVKLTDLSEGDDVDPLNVTAAHLGRKRGQRSRETRGRKSEQRDKAL